MSQLVPKVVAPFDEADDAMEDQYGGASSTDVSMSLDESVNTSTDSLNTSASTEADAEQKSEAGEEEEQKAEPVDDLEQIEEDPIYGPISTETSHNFGHLKREIIARSVTKNWDMAKREWELVYIYQETGGQCLCNHKPITDHCVIRNKQTGTEVIVGNVCVGKFGGEISQVSRLAFVSYKKIKKDPVSNRANPTLLQLALDRDILTRKDVSFYEDLWRKKASISYKQEQHLIRLTRRILMGLSEPPRTCDKCGQLVHVKRSKDNNPYWACTRDSCKVMKEDGTMGWHFLPRKGGAASSSSSASSSPMRAAAAAASSFSSPSTAIAASPSSSFGKPPASSAASSYTPAASSSSSSFSSASSTSSPSFSAPPSHLRYILTGSHFPSPSRPAAASSSSSVAATTATSSSSPFSSPAPLPTAPVRKPVRQGDRAWCPLCRRCVQTMQNHTSGEWFLACYNKQAHPGQKPAYDWQLKQRPADRV